MTIDSNQDLTVAGDATIGDGTNDVTLTFNGGNDGVIKWMEDEEYFQGSFNVFNAASFTGTDTEKIQAAIDAAEAVHGTVYIPEADDGQWDLEDVNSGDGIDACLVVSDSIIIKGEASNKTGKGTQLISSDADAHIIYIKSNDGVIIRDLWLEFDRGENDPDSGMSGIYVTDYDEDGRNSRSLFENVTVYNADYGIHFKRATYWTIRRCLLTYFNTNGVVVENQLLTDGGDSTLTDSIFIGDSGSDSGIMYKSSGGLRITNNKIFGDTDYGITINATAEGGYTQLNNIIIMGNSIENHDEAALNIITNTASIKNFQIVGNLINPALWLIGDATYGISNAVITNNYFVSPADMADTNTVKCVYAEDIVFAGNRFGANGAVTTGINIDSTCSDIYVAASNKFSDYPSGGEVGGSGSAVSVEVYSGLSVHGNVGGKGGSVFAGVNDDTPGQLLAYGGGGGEVGGKVTLYMGSDNDATDDYWNLKVDVENLKFEPASSGLAMSLSTDGDLDIGGDSLTFGDGSGTQTLTFDGTVNTTLSVDASGYFTMDTDGLIVRNTDTALADETYLLDLQHTADGDAEGDFIKCSDDYGGTPLTVFNVDYNGKTSIGDTTSLYTPSGYSGDNAGQLFELYGEYSATSSNPLMNIQQKISYNPESPDVSLGTAVFLLEKEATAYNVGPSNVYIVSKSYTDGAGLVGLHTRALKYAHGDVYAHWTRAHRETVKAVGGHLQGIEVDMIDYSYDAGYKETVSRPSSIGYWCHVTGLYDPVSNGDFATSDDWTFGDDGGGGWSHDAVNLEADCDGLQVGAVSLTQSINVGVDDRYLFTFTVKNYVAGTVTPVLDGISGKAVSANGTYNQYFSPTTSGTDTIAFQADAAFQGSIDNVSIVNSQVPIHFGYAVGGVAVNQGKRGFYNGYLISANGIEPDGNGILFGPSTDSSALSAGPLYGIRFNDFYGNEGTTLDIVHFDGVSTWTNITSDVEADDSNYSTNFLADTDDVVYVGSTHLFGLIRYLRGGAGDFATGSGAIKMYYWDGIDWATAVVGPATETGVENDPLDYEVVEYNIDDGTEASGDCFGQDGLIRFTIPGNWATGADSYNANLDSDKYYVAIQSTTSATTDPDADVLVPEEFGAHIYCADEDVGLTLRSEKDMKFFVGPNRTDIVSIGDDQLSGLDDSGLLWVGPQSGANMAFDINDIQARNNGAASTLSLNRLGSYVSIGSQTNAIRLKGTIVTIGDGSATNNLYLDFDTGDLDGRITWDEDPGEFDFNADINLAAGKDFMVNGVSCCDYVFDTGYPLKPLDELREYVNQNSHLPGMTINKGGKVGMSRGIQELLIKIEEQTLYILQLYDRLTQLEARN